MINIRNIWYNLISKYHHWKYERKCLKYFGAKPETVYLSKENFDALVQRLNEPPDPKSLEKLKKLMSRTLPWEE